MGKGITPILVALIVAVAIVLVAHMLADTALAIKTNGYVTVKGFATQQIRSDLGIFDAAIIAEAPDLKTCYANLADSTKKAKTFLKERYEIPEEQIRFQPAHLGEVYKIDEKGNATNELQRYVLRQSFEIQSNDVDLIAKLSVGIVDILKEGVKVSITQPSYIYTKLDDLKIEMIGRATNNAKERARIVAEKGNFELGSISEVRTGIFQITPVHSTTVEDYGVNDTSSIDKEIKSVVDIRYFVK
ncbi:MAG: SIMPL domain-containing protein [Candidatus Lindowbacteria bacterium]|nr:SIMPL domain-containing protein [Candidatus Lindowbacteria bacterium]